MAINSNNSGAAGTITFAQRFAGAANNQQSGRVLPNTGTQQEERKKSEFWINVGVLVDYPLENGETESRLASLPLGIPLDSVQEVPENSSNEVYAQFSATRNDLLMQIQEIAAQLAPGEAIKLKLDVELRRKKDENTGVTREAGRRKFDLIG